MHTICVRLTHAETSEFTSNFQKSRAGASVYLPSHIPRAHGVSVVRTRMGGAHASTTLAHALGARAEEGSFRSPCLLSRLSLYGFPVHLERRDVDVAAGSVSAAGNEVGEADFVHFAEIDRLARPRGRVLRRTVRSFGDDAFDVEFHPALRREHEF